ncbi:MAG: hypothetical protein K0R92_453 [Lachnospiraceae bacterium]|jgi:hypothetical protein|nr:hypothetical protein [Lachnospiraceae bacterium]
MKHKTCIGCPYISSKLCGKIVTIRGSSGAVGYRKIPDINCIIEKRQMPSDTLLNSIVGWGYIADV